MKQSAGQRGLSQINTGWNLNCFVTYAKVLEPSDNRLEAKEIEENKGYANNRRHLFKSINIIRMHLSNIRLH